MEMNESDHVNSTLHFTRHVVLKDSDIASWK